MSLGAAIALAVAGAVLLVLSVLGGIQVLSRFLDWLDERRAPHWKDCGYFESLDRIREALGYLPHHAHVDVADEAIQRINWTNAYVVTPEKGHTFWREKMLGSLGRLRQYADTGGPAVLVEREALLCVRYARSVLASLPQTLPAIDSGAYNRTTAAPPEADGA